MSTAALFWIAFAALAATGFAAAGAKALREFSVSELDDYCRRYQRRELFSDVLENHEEAALIAESLQTFASAVLLVAGILWSVGPSPTTIGEFLRAVVGSSLTLLTVTTWIPWALIRVWESPFIVGTWRFWRGCARLFFPLIVVANMVDELIHRLSGSPNDDDEDEGEALEDEIRSMVTAGEHDGLLEKDTRQMIESVIDLGDTDVSDIMTSRGDMEGIDVTLSWDDTLQFAIESGRTRLPVYRGSFDEVIGVLYVKDLLVEMARPPGQRRALLSILRRPYFVPKTMSLDELLQDFLHTRNHLAIVVDEYQAVCGIVTIEDVLEEIVGEIVDESDKEEEPGEILRIDDKTVEALGRAHLDELNEQCDLALPESDDYDTIGGLLVSRLGAVPKPGASIEVDDWLITVLEANRRRVERVKIERVKIERGQVAAQTHR